MLVNGSCLSESSGARSSGWEEMTGISDLVTAVSDPVRLPRRPPLPRPRMLFPRDDSYLVSFSHEDQSCLIVVHQN